MATDKENKEYTAAMKKIAALEVDLEKARTPIQEDRIEDRLEKQLKRLEALEAKFQPKQKEEEEEEEEAGDQCPQCGYVLTDLGDGTYYCAGCKDYFGPED